MNQGKIWLVVKPTVGLPAFLGSVALISLCVHSAVLSNTTWMPAFFQGGMKAPKAAAVPTTSAPLAQAGTTNGTVVAAAAPREQTAPPGR